MKRVDRLLPAAVERHVLDIARAQSVLRDWDLIVGPGLAERSWPDRYDRGVVWVAVKGSAWAQELRLMKEVILERLRARGGQSGLFLDVRFGVRKLPEHEVPETLREETSPEAGLSIREIAEKRLKRWKE